MVQRRGPRLTAAQQAKLWRWWRQGESLNAIGRALGRIPKGRGGELSPRSAGGMVSAGSFGGALPFTVSDEHKAVRPRSETE